MIYYNNIGGLDFVNGGRGVLGKFSVGGIHKS